MKKFMDEFKEFITKGNAFDLAVGVIIGGAFGKIINSLVADVIMPPIGMLLGKVDFNNLYVQLNKAAVSIPKGTRYLWHRNRCCGSGLRLLFDDDHQFPDHRIHHFSVGKRHQQTTCYGQKRGSCCRTDQ